MNNTLSFISTMVVGGVVASAMVITLERLSDKISMGNKTLEIKMDTYIVDQRQIKDRLDKIEETCYR